MAWNKRNKFNAVKSFQYGRWWTSRLELAVYEILLKMEKEGLIKDIKCQVQTKITLAKIRYRADFSFMNLITGEEEYVEAKGFPGERWRMIKNLWPFYGIGKLHIYMGSYKYPKLRETIIPKK